MKKQTKQLLILLVVLAALLGVYAVLRHYNSRPITVTSGERVDLVNLSDLTRITFTANDGSELTFVKEGEWIYEDDPSFPLDQSKLENFESLLAGLYVTRTFEERDALSAYGLDPVQNWITAVTGSGESTTILVGDAASSGGNYACVEGTDTVSIVSSALARAMNTDLQGMAPDEEEEG